MATEELNFARTARKLFISQQSPSNHISNLEKGFDVVLLNRTSPFTLTYAGRALRTRARELLDLRDETYKEISGIKDFSTGQLAIGVFHTRGRVILPGILPIYQAQFPDIELWLMGGNSGQLTSDLLHGNVDLMIDLLSFTMENVETVPIYDEGVLMVVPDELLKRIYPSRLEEIKQILSSTADVTLLERCPFILLKEGNQIRTISDEIPEDAQMSPRVVLETKNIETVLALYTKGVEITFYPRMFVNPDQSSHSYHNIMLGNSHLNLYSLNYSRAHGALGIGYHKGRHISRATREFIHTTQGRIPYPANHPAE